MRKPDFGEMHAIAKGIVELVHEKDAHYGSSWKKRGGVGAYMMACRPLHAERFQQPDIRRLGLERCALLYGLACIAQVFACHEFHA